jgi:hypothetical protein
LNGKNYRFGVRDYDKESRIMMNFVAIFSGVGLGIPILFSLYWQLADRFFEAGQQSTFLLKLQLLFWPSSMFMMGTVGASTSDSVKMWLLSASANVVVYAIIGSLFWLGINKNKMFLVFAFVAIGFGWYKLWNL